MASRGAALVTGGARRIGRVLAAVAAEAGYDVAIHVRSPEDDAEAAASEVRGKGRKAAILACDLRKESQTVALVGEAESELGPVTLLINSASVFEEDSFAGMNRASWDLHLETNLRAPLVLAQAFARRLPADREGLIVNVLDRRMTAQEAVDAPRLHLDGAELYAEPGVAGLAATGLPVTTFRAPNLFFGGCQAVERDPATGALSGAGDPRRGGAAVVA